MEVGEELEGFFVAAAGVFVIAVNGGEDDDGNAVADQGVGAVLEFTGGVALGVDVGGLLELEGAFAGDGVVDAAAEEEEGVGVAVFFSEMGETCLPNGELRLDRGGELGQFRKTGGDGGLIEMAEPCALVERKQVEDGELAGEALGGGDGELFAGAERERDGGFAGHGRGWDVGDGEGFLAVGLSFAEGGQGVGGFAGLGDDDYGGFVGGGWGGQNGICRTGTAAAVFAGVLDVDGEAAQVFKRDLGDETSVAAGAAGSNEDLALRAGPLFELRPDLGGEGGAGVRTGDVHG